MKKRFLVSLVIFVAILAACQTGEPESASRSIDTPIPEPVEAPSLAGTTWQWVEFTGEQGEVSIDDSQYYLITFQQDGSVNIKADCNRALGDYTARDGEIMINVGPMTRAMCAPGSRSDEFVELLDGEAAYFIDDVGDLVTELVDGEGVLVFSPAVDEEAIQDEIGQGDTSIMLWSGPWQWLSFSSESEQFEVENPEAYQISFMPDGSLLLAADCNIVQGEYTTEVSILNVEVGPSTLALCPGESRSEQFIQLVENVALYYFSMDELIIDLEDGGGTMVFQRLSSTDLTDALTAHPWQWVEFTSPVDQFEVESPENYQLTFNPGGTMDVLADCNMAQGDYAAVDQGLSIALRLMTPALCPGESRSEQFMELIQDAAIYSFDGDRLIIDLFADGGTLVFTPVESAESMSQMLTQNPWQWTSFTSPVEQFDIDAPAKYQLIFNPDGSLNITADCNLALGSYSVDEGSLTIEIGPVTLALCPGDSRSEQFIQLLPGAAIYLFEDGDLYIDLMADGGTFRFEAVQ